MALITVGTKIYSFLDHPYRIIEGTITEVIPKEKQRVFRYRAGLYDPVRIGKFHESFFRVFLTAEEAEKAYKEISDLLFKA